MAHPIGVDIGGTGIKGASVDLDAGDFAAERVRIDTPRPSDLEAVGAVFKRVIDAFPGDAGTPVGVTFPGIIRDGTVKLVANLDPSWLNVDANTYFSDAAGRPVKVLNDADAAGLAEVKYGAAHGHQGLVMVTTLGTGIGGALIYRGHLVPNFEAGHIPLHGDSAEKFAANSVREAQALSWEEWAIRLTEYYRLLEKLFSPDLFVVGGGVSKKAKKFLPLIDIETPMVRAELKNAAGIVGAALYAADES